MNATNGNGTALKPARDSEPVEADAQTWWLAPVGNDVRKKYANRCRARARQRLLEDTEALGDEASAEWFDRLEGKIDAGDYEWGPPPELNGTGLGAAVRAVLDTTTGKLELVQLLLEPAHGDVPLHMVAGILATNPKGLATALRAAMGLPPNPEPPAKAPGETAPGAWETHPPAATATAPATGTTPGPSTA